MVWQVTNKSPTSHLIGLVEFDEQHNKLTNGQQTTGQPISLVHGTDIIAILECACYREVGEKLVMNGQQAGDAHNKSVGEVTD